MELDTCDRATGQYFRWVKGGCHPEVDGTAGLPSAPEMPCAPRQLRLVPQAVISLHARGPDPQALGSVDNDDGLGPKPAYLQAPCIFGKRDIRDRLLREPARNGDPGVQTTRKPR